jgi:hypothetical protein
MASLSADRVSQAETALAAAKAVRGVSPEEAIHCADLFSDKGRQKKTVWRSFTHAAIRGLIEAVCVDVGAVSSQPMVCCIDRASVPPGVTASGSMFEGLNVKGIATFAYMGIFSHLLGRYPPGVVRIYMDPDSTKIPWGPGRKRQAELTRSLHLDLGERSATGLFVPHIERKPKPRLLEVADIYAYVATRAAGPARDPWRGWLRDLYLGVIRAQEIEFTFSAHQAWDKTAAHLGIPRPVLRQNPVRGQVVDLSGLIRRESQFDDHPLAPRASTPPVPLRRPPAARPREPRPAPAARRVQANGDPAQASHD